MLYSLILMRLEGINFSAVPQTRLFSSSNNIATTSAPYSTPSNSGTQLNPFHISGFTQSDGSFHISLYKDSSLRHKIRVVPVFIITQDGVSKAVLQEIMQYFKGGHLNVDKRTNAYNLRINSLSLNLNTVLPHFASYPVMSAKYRSFFMFKRVVIMLKNKEHLTRQGLPRIIAIAYSMNTASTRTPERKQEILKSLGFDNYDEGNLISSLEKEMQSGLNCDRLDPYFISGVADGDSSFYVSLKGNNRIVPAFTIIQHKESKDLLCAIQSYFKCGALYEIKPNYVRFVVEDISSLINIIIPHFERYPLHTIKWEKFSFSVRFVDSSVRNSIILSLGVRPS